MEYNANEVINGLYGKLFDDTGVQLQDTQNFEVADEFEKVDIKVPGQFHTSSKVMSGKLSGKITMNKRDSRLQKKILENPTDKYQYIGKLQDPDAKGNEAVLLKGVSFDGSDIMKWALGELTTAELAFTCDDVSYTEWID